MSAANDKGGALGPSLLRALFASLRRKPAAAPHAATPPAPSTAPVPRPLLAIPGPMALASDTAARPTPAPEPAKLRQISLVDPPGGNHRADRVFAAQDFLGRFRRAVAKGGITAKDPMLPILDLLGEMLLHFTHLTEDLDGDLNSQAKSMAAELRTVIGQARGLLAEHTRTVEAVMNQAVTRIEAAATKAGVQRDAQLKSFGQDTEALFRSTVIHQTRMKLWTGRFIVATVIVIAAGGGYWCGRQAGIDQAMAAVQSVRTGEISILLRNGSQVGKQWANLAEWNNLSLVQPTCAPQPENGAYRLACTYTFWATPPVQTVPTVR